MISLSEAAVILLLMTGAVFVVILLAVPKKEMISRENPVADTGQTAIYISTYGEDSDYSINLPSYTDNTDETVTDNITSLMWQKKDSGPETVSQIDARRYCQDLNLAGHADWRLPTYRELASILYFGFSSNHRYALPGPFFPGSAPSAVRGGYWTSTTLASDSSFAWTFIYWSSDSAAAGYAASAHRMSSAAAAAKCVRGTMLLSKHFTRHGNGTITDDRSGLVWQQEDDGMTRTWEHAIMYCESLSLAGLSDWRLPTIKELSSLVDTSRYNPAADGAYFPAMAGSATNRWWSSTYNPGNALYQYAYSIDFSDGEWQPLSELQDLNHVRCVRGGQ